MSDWLLTWNADGPQSSQIKRCGDVLGALVARLEQRVRDLPTDDVAFSVCRAIDSDAAVIERLYRLLAERFDQRKAGSKFAPALRAADELIWSCVLQTDALASTRIPLPLAYVEPAYSPTATPRIKPPPGGPVRDRQLAEILRVLPVPLIGLPVGVAQEAWWLALLAHEVGHHVQYDVDKDAVTRTGNELKAATGDAVWEAWRLEVFADAFSIMALGPVAITAVAELEWDDAKSMATPRDLYPPVIVRLALMAQLADALRFTDVPYLPATWQPTIDQLPEPDRAQLIAWLAQVPTVATTLRQMKLERGSLATLADPAAPATSNPGIRRIDERLAGKNVGLVPDRAMPRTVISRAFAAYQRLASETDDAKRLAALGRLSDQTVATIQDVADPTVKRGGKEPPPIKTVVDAIAGILNDVE